MQAENERRRAPRAPFTTKIMLRTRAGEIFPAWGDNLSELGMLLRASTKDGEALPMDQDLWLTFTLPKIPHALQVGARVVRHQRNERGGALALGVQFTDIPADIRRMVRTFVFTGLGEVKNYTPPTPLQPL
jgi:c-di-GMP-binding flagellar brake protein YcgR